MSATTSSWSAPPLIPGPWKDIPPADGLALAIRIGAAMQEQGEGPGVWITELQRLRTLPLKIYVNWLLGEAEVQLPDGNCGLANFLYGPGRRFVLLDHVSQTLHRLNEHELVPLRSEALVAEYVRFYLCHSASNARRFQIVESPEQLTYADGVPREQLPPAVADIRPLRVSPIALVRNVYTATVAAFVLYGETLYRAQYLVNGDAVQMTDEQPLCKLPVRAELLTGPLRILENRRYGE